MARVKSKIKMGGLFLAFLLCLPVSLIAEQSDPKNTTVELEESEPAVAEKQALSLNEHGEATDEPLYAGTSMWFLLSIALLGSIAVKRRVDPND